MNQAPNPPQWLDPLSLPSGEVMALGRSRLGVPVAQALAAYKKVYREGVREAAPWKADLPEVVRTLREESSEGEVVKFVCRVPGRLADGPAAPGDLAERSLEIESVLIPMIGSTRQRTYTLCVSSQVGCAMGCTFCETAQMGLIRSLSPREIVAQWYTATHVIGLRPKNIVFMGMGEPMDNFENVMAAINILRDHNGAHVPASKITISTVGRVDGMRQMKERLHEPGLHRLNIALSLNAPNDTVRSGLMPINRRWNMSQLQQELIDWPRYGGNKICLEYVLIPGVNDAPEHADEVAAFMKPLTAGDGSKARAVLNLIPYNPRRSSPWPAPTEAQVEAFMRHLFSHGVFVKRRRTKGREMMGACGQLGNEEIRQRRLVQLTRS